MNAESAAQFLPLIMIVLMMAAMYFWCSGPSASARRRPSHAGCYQGWG